MKVKFFGLMCIVFLFSFGIVSSSTIITDDSVSTNVFTLNSGSFLQGAGAINQISYIQDDSANGAATGLNGVRGIFVLGKYAYLTSQDDNALSIVDISDPTDMAEVGVIFDDSVGGNAVALEKPVAVYVSGKYAYVVGNNSLSIIDISNTANLVEVGYISDDSVGGTATNFGMLTGVYVSGKFAYVVSHDDGVLSVIDISDRTNPVEESDIAVSDGLTDIYVSGRYAYVTSQISDSLSIIDIHNPKKLAKVGSISDNSRGGTANYLDGAQTVYVLGRYAYVAANGSISIIDISDSSNLVEVGAIQDDGLGGDATAINGLADIYVSGNYAYVTSFTDDTLSVFDVSEVDNVVEVNILQDDSLLGGVATSLEGPWGLFVSGKYAYVTSSEDDAFTVIELSGARTPLLETGTLQADFLQVMNNFLVGNDANIRGGLSVGASLLVSGNVATSGNVTLADMIKFKFGETIDNIVDGWIRINGNLNVTGNLSVMGYQGLTGNYSSGTCWSAYSSGIMYSTNCTLI